MFEKLNAWRIRTYLKMQGIININECIKEEEFLEKSKEYYKNISYKDSCDKKIKLKEKLILLDNEKNKLNNINYITEIGLVVTVMIALITTVFSVVDKVNNISNTYTNNQIEINRQIEGYEDKILDAKNNLGIYENKTEYYNEIIKDNTDRKQKLIDQFESDGKSAKSDILSYSNLLNSIFVIFMLLLLLIFVEIFIFKPINKMNKVNRGIAINIHKSIVEELLKDLEESETKQENEVIKKLGEIEKTVEGTKQEVETLNIIFSSLQK